MVGYVGAHCVCGDGFITNIATHPDFRRKGVAKLLLSALIDELSQKEIAFISLEVRESNLAAQALYASFDFKVEGCRKDYYRLPVENGIIMTKRLN